MVKEKNKKRIEDLKKEIRYEKKKMECCGCGKSDLMYLRTLEQELETLKN